MPSPRFDRLTPLGASAGSTVEVEAIGADIEEANTLLFDHKGITAKHLKDRKFAVTVAADVPAGTYDARLVGKYGVTNPRIFAVSRGLTEVTEKGPNEDRETAQQVPVNCVINGSSKQGREAVFKFAAKKGQRVVAWSASPSVSIHNSTEICSSRIAKASNWHSTATTPVKTRSWTSSRPKTAITS